jgi:hypothetical protein
MHNHSNGEHTLEGPRNVTGEVYCHVAGCGVVQGGDQDWPEEAARAVVQKLPVPVVVQAAP